MEHVLELQKTFELKTFECYGALHDFVHNLVFAFTLTGSSKKNIYMSCDKEEP